MKNLCLNSLLLHFVQLLAFGLAISSGAPKNIAKQICAGVINSPPYLFASQLSWDSGTRALSFTKWRPSCEILDSWFQAKRVNVQRLPIVICSQRKCHLFDVVHVSVPSGRLFLQWPNHAAAPSRAHPQALGCPSSPLPPPPEHSSLRI